MLPSLILFNPLCYKACDRFAFGSHFAQSGAQFAVLNAVFRRHCAADLNKSLYQNVRNYHQTHVNTGVQGGSHFAQCARNSQFNLSISVHLPVRNMVPILSLPCVIPDFIEVRIWFAVRSLQVSFCAVSPRHFST